MSWATATEYDEEIRDEESFDPIPNTPENSDDEGNGEEDLGLNVGMESIFETTSQMDAQTPTSVAPLPMIAPTMTPSTIASITTTSQAPILPTTAPSTIIQDLPNFGLLNLYKALVEVYESDKIILDTYGETITLKRRRDDDADKDEEPSAGPDQRSKRHREGQELKSASAPTETATRSVG
nr:hypothetical protein [Tanacetum cinerariifolium]